jgi:hypothetical protein
MRPFGGSENNPLKDEAQSGHVLKPKAYLPRDQR